MGCCKTTLESAESHWREVGAKQLGRGYAGIGAGFHIDGGAKLADDKVLLVDIADVEWEVNRKTRFAFFEGVLFSVQVTLREIGPQSPDYAFQFDDQDIKDLEKNLREKYGTPAKSFWDRTSAGKVRIWNFGPNQLTLLIYGLSGSTLSLTYQPLKSQVDLHKKEVCEKSPGCTL